MVQNTLCMNSFWLVDMYPHLNCLCTLKANEVKYVLQVLYQNAKNGFTGNLLWVEISLEMPACQSCELDHNQIMTTTQYAKYKTKYTCIQSTHTHTHTDTHNANTLLLHTTSVKLLNV